MAPWQAEPLPVLQEPLPAEQLVSWAASPLAISCRKSLETYSLAFLEKTSRPTVKALRPLANPWPLRQLRLAFQR